MPARDDVIGHARELHEQARWDDACLEFLGVGAIDELGVQDLELLAEAAQLTGRHDVAVSALERAFEVRASATDWPRRRPWRSGSIRSSGLRASSPAPVGGWRG